jgi:hypothetical protein
LGHVAVQAQKALKARKVIRGRQAKLAQWVRQALKVSKVQQDRQACLARQARLERKAQTI